MISVIVPAFNEKDNIIPLIDDIHHELEGFNHQIVVVDDDSPDGTFEIVRGAEYPFVKALLRTMDRSLAKSIRAGLEAADGDIFVVMDSDFNHQPRYLRQMVLNLEFYDAVVASRFVYGGLMDDRVRHLLSWCFNIFVRVMTGKSITDTLYGFFAVHRSNMQKLDYDKIFWGYGDYCIRLMYYLQEEGAKILQIPVVNGRRIKGQGNSRFLKVFMQYTGETFSLVCRERIKK